MLIKTEHNGHLLEHDEETHLYLLDSKPLDGVTSIISAGYPKSQRIYDWQTREGVKWALEVIDSEQYESIDEVIKESPNAFKKALDEACDIGHIVHEYAYCVEAKKPIDLVQYESHENYQAIITACNQFDEWKKKNDDEIIALEELVCSIKYGYAGRFDRLASRKGAVTLTDYKTSSGFYITQFIQMAAYAMAIEEWMGLEVKDIEIVRFDKKTGKLSTRGLQQLADTVKLKPETCLKRLKEQFVATLDTYQFKEKFDRYIRK